MSAISDAVVARLNRRLRGALVRAGTGAGRSAAPAVAAVFVWWDPAGAPGALARLLTLPLQTMEVVVTADGPLPTVDDPRVRVVRGDNRHGEFSGYDAGVAARLGRGGPPDVWLICNDRYDAYGHDFTSLDLATVAGVVAELGALCGQVDRTAAPIGADDGSWVRSSFMLMGEATRRRIGSFVSVDDAALAGLVPESMPEDGPLFGALGAFGDHLEDWLTGASRTGLTRHWYRAAPATPDTWPALRRKAKAILNEHELSARCRRAGCDLLPIHLVAALAAAGLPAPEIRDRLVGPSAPAAPDRYEDRSPWRLRLLAGAYAHLRVRRIGARAGR